MLTNKWQHPILDKEVLIRAGLRTLQAAELRWAGHVTRMPDDVLPNRFMHLGIYGEPYYGKRPIIGRQMARLNDCLKKLTTSFNIDVTDWKTCVQNRPSWGSMIHSTARTAENRIAEAQKKASGPRLARPTHNPCVEEC